MPKRKEKNCLASILDGVFENQIDILQFIYSTKKIKRSNKRCGCKLTFISLLKRMLNLENHGEQGRKKNFKGKGNNMKCWKIMIFVDD